MKCFTNLETCLNLHLLLLIFTCYFIGKASSVATHPVQPVKESFESKKTSTKPRRVVVTGMGVVSSLGHDADTFYANLLEGKSGISEIENFDCKEFPTVSLFKTL